MNTYHKQGGAPNAKRVLFVSQFSYPAEEEIRLSKLALTLVALGYQCSVACPGTMRDDQNDRSPLRILRFFPLKSKWGELIAKPVPWNLLWVCWLIVTVVRMRPSTIVLRNVRCGLEAIVCTKLIGGRLVADLSENYAALYEASLHFPQRSKTYILAVASRWLESVVARCADHVVAVCDENAARLNRFRSGRRSVAVIGNLPLATEFLGPNSAPDVSPPFRLVYLGLVDRFRVIEIVLHALAQLGRRDIRFDVIGDGPELPRLKGLAKRIDVFEQTVFHGLIPRKQALHIVRSANIGLIPHIVSSATQYTLPNKLYDYYAAALPIIATNVGPLRRELELACAGFALDNDPATWADTISHLCDHPAMAAELGMNGFRFGARHRTWESQLPTIKTIFPSD